MSNITAKQWYQIASGAISGLITGAALMQQLVGQDLALKIVAALGLSNIILSSVGTALSGQASSLKEVQAMPGVDKIRINDQANPTLAAMAVDPTNTKIVPTPEAAAIVAATAATKGA